MPRHINNANNNSNNNSMPVNGRLYIEYWIDDIEDVREEPIHIARLNIQYRPPLTRDTAIEYITNEYNSEVVPRLPHQDEIDYTVDFSGNDVAFDPSGHNEENSGYISQIAVVIHPSDPDRLMTLLMQNNNNQSQPNNWAINGEHIVLPQNGNTSTASPPNSPRSVGSMASIGSTKTTNNRGFNGGKRRRTKKRNTRRKRRGIRR